MKTSERHRLKENAVASTISRAKEAIENYRTPIIAGVVAVLVIVAGAVGFLMWRSYVDGEARTMLADALVVARAQVAPTPAPGTTAPPPVPAGSYATEKARNEAALAKFTAAAEAFPSSSAGIAARYHAAALLSTLGRPGEAAKRYQDVIALAGPSLYGEMAKLGVAEMQAAGGQYEKAIAGYKEMSVRKDGAVPVDGILMQLARVYGVAGKPADAKQTFKRVVDEFPQSPFAAEAKRGMDQIRG